MLTSSFNNLLNLNTALVMSKNQIKFSNELLDQLMKDYDPTNPEMLVGKDGLLSGLKKALIERAMNAELDHHLGYKKNQTNNNEDWNYRNGFTRKSIITKDDKINIDTPRDRNGSFEPLIVKKGQRTFTGFDDKIISIYARGMTVSEISGHLQEIYEIEISGDFISNVALLMRLKPGRIEV